MCLSGFDFDFDLSLSEVNESTKIIYTYLKVAPSIV